MRAIFLCLVVFLVPFVYAHGDAEPTPHTVDNGHTESEVEALTQLELAQEMAVNQQANRGAAIWPWTFFSQGRWIGGIVCIIIWLLLLKAFYELVMMVLHRFM